MIKKAILVFQERGFLGLLHAILTRLGLKTAKSFPVIKKIVAEGTGLEIGGLSSIFKIKNLLPVYPHIQSLDNCNFSHQTMWEGDITKGDTYFYDKNHAPGRQYVLEATELHSIADESYDFLLSSHVLEHTANPIKALKEWMRVIKPHGHLILLVPHKDGTFDHNRPVTTLDHLIQDFESDITEKDLSHLNEILELHDLSRDPEAGNNLEFVQRSNNNYDNRGLHHHVFNSHLAVQLIDYLKFYILEIEAIAPMHILIVAQKTQINTIPNNQKYFDYLDSSQFETPFTSDKV